MKTALVWFRRDLRLADNPALAHALGHAERVVPVYILPPEALEGAWTPGAASRWWLHHSLAALDAQLRESGAQLVIRQGDPLAQLRRLVGETGAEGVFWNRRYEPAWVKSDRRVGEALIEDGVEAQAFAANLLVEPWALKTGSGGPYRVYTPFSRSARALGLPRQPIPAPRRIPMPAKKIASDDLASLKLLPTIVWDGGLVEAWTPGEDGAHARLDRFCRKALDGYAAGRDRPDQVLTSLLSPHLHFGEITPVQALARVQRELASESRAGLHGGAEVYERELYWREFAHHVLHHFPKTPEAPMNERFAGFVWRKPREYADDLRRWQRGQTGVPIVDAGMRQLWTTGWMHNRVRMIVASYLVKNLLIPWQEGERWFWGTLVDADLANNTLGWQWVAGCGADAAPYFRIFNPVTQSQKFDPEGRYLRHWVPEIGKLPDKALHAPWLADAGLLRQHGFTLGQHYPRPAVDLGESRARALEAFARIKG
ncbi:MULTISPECIES: cryptochrome/photolyase family protein [Hydrocarboniphaga]|uniref:cryptochrome/photolyase family protein n=1 Tax=Hydrocarboniphaga TaxID=243627 RepID=UPI00058C7133|nr:MULTISPECIES: deoxyribodipyrimidine photo-lyase [Hydrocarboniphaga]MDZ4081003.1 deoxyribodipyrimidine photo-lyase [Hydrocarboniphaga sp.]